MHFALRQLHRTLQVLIPKGGHVIYGPSYAKELVDLLEPSKCDQISKALNFKTESSTKVLMLSMTDSMDDIYSELLLLKQRLNPSVRIYVVTMSRLWGALSQRIYGLAKISKRKNWIPPREIKNLFEQAGYESVEQRNVVLLPIYVPLISRLLNRWLAQIPIIKELSVFTVTTIRPLLRTTNKAPTVSVVIAARNEVGNIRNLVKRTPIMSLNQELILWKVAHKTKHGM